MINPIAWLRKKFAAADIRRAYAFGREVIAESGYVDAYDMWRRGRSGNARDWFDLGFEMALAEYLAMEHEVKVAITLSGGMKDGMVVARCDSYGNWRMEEGVE